MSMHAMAASKPLRTPSIKPAARMTIRYPVTAGAWMPPPVAARQVRMTARPVSTSLAAKRVDPRRLSMRQIALNTVNAAPTVNHRIALCRSIAATITIAVSTSVMEPHTKRCTSAEMSLLRSSLSRGGGAVNCVFVGAFEL